MTITSEQLKQAFAPITKISEAPADPTTVDLEKVATALVTETGEFVNGDDPMSQLDSLVARVDKIDALLESATEDEHGNIVVPADSEIAKEFAVDKANTPPTNTPEPGKGSEDGEETDTSKADEDDLSDNIEWDRDLSPPEMPADRRAHLTKGERPVHAQRDSRSRSEIYADARERALERRSGMGAGRTLS